MNRSKDVFSKASFWLVIGLGLAGLGATRCGDSPSDDRAESTRQQLLALWAEMPHPSPACVDDSASTPLSTDGTVQALVTGPRDKWYRFSRGNNGSQVTLTVTGSACGLSMFYGYCDGNGFRQTDYSLVSCVPPGYTINSGSSQTCTVTLPAGRIVLDTPSAATPCTFSIGILQI